MCDKSTDSPKDYQKTAVWEVMHQIWLPDFVCVWMVDLLLDKSKSILSRQSITDVNSETMQHVRKHFHSTEACKHLVLRGYSHNITERRHPTKQVLGDSNFTMHSPTNSNSQSQTPNISMTTMKTDSRLSLHLALS